MKCIRYLVVKCVVEIDANNLDDCCEVLDYVASELDYKVEFSGEVEIGNGSVVAAKIENTEVIGLLDSKPIGC